MCGFQGDPHDSGSHAMRCDGHADDTTDDDDLTDCRLDSCCYDAVDSCYYCYFHSWSLLKLMRIYLLVYFSHVTPHVERSTEDEKEKWTKITGLETKNGIQLD